MRAVTRLTLRVSFFFSRQVPELAELGDDDVPDLVENFDEKKESS